jgi:hypothetical protein
MRNALAAWHMGRVINTYRHHPWHGTVLTQSTVGAWFGLTQAQLSRVETGHAPEELSKLVRWATLLGIPPELLWFKVPGTAGTSPAVVPHVTVPVTVDREIIVRPVDQPEASDDGLGDIVDRLDPQMGAARKPSRPSSPSQWACSSRVVDDPAGLSQLTAALDHARRYRDGSVVALFRAQIERCKADDGRYGAGRALPLVLGVLGAISEHVREVKPGVRGQLLSLASEGAEFAGWLCRDLNDPAHATFWYDRAMEWAQEAGDTGMQGYVLLRKSQMAYDARDAHRVMTFAEAAYQGPWQLPPSVRVEVMQQRALGLAVTGSSAREIEEHMTAARDHLATAAAIAEPDSGGGVITMDTLLLRQAACYTEMGKPVTAAQLFGSVLSNGCLSRRDVGFFGARRAVALALSGDPEEAAEVGLAAAVVAGETGSSRTWRLLSDLVRTLRPWITRPGPAELRQAIVTSRR